MSSSPNRAIWMCRGLLMLLLLLHRTLVHCGHNHHSTQSDHLKQNHKNESDLMAPTTNFNQTAPTPAKLPTPAALVTNANRQGGRSLNFTQLTTQGKLLLRLIKLVHDLSSKHNATNSSLPSESRSMLSWFRLKKANAQRKESFPFEFGASAGVNEPPHGHHHHHHHHHPHHGHQPHPHHHHHHHHGPEYDLDPLALRPELVYGALPEGVNPSSFMFLPPLSDTQGIDYWLKLIENANIDDKDYVHFPDGKEVKAKQGKSKKSKNKELGGKIKKNEITLVNDDYEEENHKNYINSDTRLRSTKPIEYDTSPRCDKFTDDICVDDFEYPEHAIVDEIYKRKDLFQLMYSEVKGDQPLVDGMSRDMEENFSSDYYYNNDPEGDDYEGYYDGANKTMLQDDGHNDGKKEKVGFVCRSEVLYAKPKLAKNIKGKWRVIVNAGEFTQTVRMEKCIKPNSRCRFIADDKYESRCAQISAIHRLLVFEKGKGFFIDTFRIPTACTCHVQTNKQYDSSYNKLYNSDYSTESSSTTYNVKKEKPKSNLGQTLWTLVGSSKAQQQQLKDQSVSLDKFVQLSDQTKNINADLVKLLPHLALMAPEQVLQQLLEGYSKDQAQRKSYLMPGYKQAELVDRLRKLAADEPLSYDDEEEERSTNNKHKSNLPYTTEQLGGATILTRSRSNSGDAGAPIVQVILPIAPMHRQQSSDKVSTYDPNDYVEQKEYLLKGDNGKYPNKMIDSSSAYLELHSTPNSSVTEPSNFDRGNGSMKSMNVTTLSQGKETGGGGGGGKSAATKDNKKAANKKINFAYHPIFEYIVD